MLTFQDFEQATDKKVFVQSAINEHLASLEYKTALSADNYDHQKNELILNYIRTIFTMTGVPVEDFTASNNKICNNFFHRLNTQRCTYLLGNGVTFSEHKRTTRVEGQSITVDETKELLGDRFDGDLKKIGYNALIHGVCFGFWNLDRLHVFPLTQFKPLWDEETGALRAGIRFWRLDKDKPLIVVLYEEDGYTKYKSAKGSTDLEEIEPKKAYKTIYSVSEADGEQIAGEENYTKFPIIPMWGSRLKQSTLVGMKNAIDSFDLIRSGFANDLTDCAQIYWILENCTGMSESDLARFRDRLKINHIAVADNADGASATPYTQDIPYQARKEYLDMIRAGLYEDFGGLDVHTVAAGATNDHIDAAYQPLDEEADDFEYQVSDFIQNLLELIGIEDNPVFKRNRISNEAEQTNMILTSANYLDDETVLNKLPFISVDEVQNILMKRELEGASRFEPVGGAQEEEIVVEEEDRV